MKDNRKKETKNNRRKNARLIISLLATLMLVVGCMGMAYADDAENNLQGIDLNKAKVWVHTDYDHGPLEVIEDGYQVGKMFIHCNYSDELDPPEQGCTCGICEYWLELELYINTPDDSGYTGEPHEATLSYEWLAGGSHFPDGYKKGEQPGTPENIESLKYVKTEYEGVNDTEYEKQEQAPTAVGTYLATVTISIRNTTAGPDPAYYTFSKKYEITPENRNDPIDQVSGTLLARLKDKGKRALTLSWNKIYGAGGYDIFFTKCGKNAKPGKVKTIKGNKTFKWTKTGLQKHKPYKAFVKAWVNDNGQKKYVKTTPKVCIYTTGGTKKYTNAKSVTVNKTKITLKKGSTFKIKAKVIKTDKKKKLMPASYAPKLRYLSSNNKIATVTKKGAIKANAKGSCKIYVYAATGVKKTVTVKVK